MEKKFEPCEPMILMTEEKKILLWTIFNTIMNCYDKTPGNEYIHPRTMSDVSIDKENITFTIKVPIACKKCSGQIVNIISKLKEVE